MRTQAGLYATEAQLEWEELVSGPTTMVLDIDRLGGEAAAVQAAQKVLGFPPSKHLAWFIRAGDAVTAARVADRLTSQGVAPVFLVY